MKKINVLSPGFISPNSAAYLFPLIKFKSALMDHDFDIVIKYAIDDDVTECDFLLIDSKFFEKGWSKDFDGTLKSIAALNRKAKVIWCDQSDSTGTFLGQILPHVHRYLKAQILKNRSEYMNNHYASRIYTEYYHKKYGIMDQSPFTDQPAKNKDDLKKIGISWNSGFMHYGMIGPYMIKVRERIPLDSMLAFASIRSRAKAPRLVDVTCRMGISYEHDTICYQRRKIRAILKDTLSTDKIARSAYFREIDNSKICVSPFGMGEITLKDFECFLSGSMLLKPDMNHMETWPNLFQDRKTCLFHSWDVDDIKDKIDWALRHNSERIEIAKAGQDLYESHTLGDNAGKLFAEHIKEILC
ncbi:MAG: glycosyltransferase [Alphaproteobacteria bacterium]|nr:glycosyltransferase [Alphaproteobacteria bacterium]